MIPEGIIQQITARIDIIEIITGFIALKKRGANYLGLCPFHGEKTPSFTVSPAKGIYKCFGCGVSGTAVTFLMEHEKFSFPEAMKWLGKKYNVEVPESTYEGESSKASALHIFNEFAASHFHANVQEAAAYLEQRNINEQSIERFLIGYDNGSLASVAITAMYSQEIATLAGVVTNGKDAYNGRLIFPIHNTAGKIAGFGARKISDSDNGPKYLNTHDNDAYNKSNILYGLYQASKAISKADECILVEGYTDVIALHQAGIENVVASSGTSLTQGQVRLIKRYTKNITILYDGDAAGEKAAVRGVDIALEEGLRVKGILLPPGDDPDSYISKVGQPSFVSYMAANKKDFIVLQLSLLLKENSDTVKRSEVVNTVAASIAKLAKPEDFSLRGDYIRQCAHLLQTDEKGMLALVNSLLPGQEQSNGGQQAHPTEEHIDEKSLVRVLLEHGDKIWDEHYRVAEFIFHEFDENDLLPMMNSQPLVNIITHYREMLSEGTLPVTGTFLYSNDTEIASHTADLLAGHQPLSESWPLYYKGTLDDPMLYKKEILSTLVYLKLNKIKKMIRENQQDLKRQDISDTDLFNLVRTHQYLKKLEIEYSSELGATIFMT